MAAAESGTINDVEHIVIFMQENRPFDHYYGTLSGVRGFNDRGHPKLRSGKSVFHQPITKFDPENAFCGCAACDFEWDGASEVKDLLTKMPCSHFVQTMKGATPSVEVADGNLCSDLLSGLLNTSIQHLKVGDALKSSSTCSSDLKVNVTSSMLKDGASNETYQLPYPLHFENTSATCMSAPSMGYDWDIGIWNGGLMDAWNTARDAGFGMAYFNRTDLPFYYALAEAFTIGDQYFQSTFTATDPNRLHQFTGSNGLSVNSSYNVLDDSEPAGMEWKTIGEVFEENNITWKVYQEQDNFGDNAFEWFEQYKNATPGNPLHDKGLVRSENFTEDFRSDINSGKLPQVSILIAPAWLSEHATNHPADGQELSSKIIQILGANKTVYSKTAFILNYDEGGQFFDHHWTPTPPPTEADGKSNIPVWGEISKTPYAAIPAGNPIGLGFRVPLMLISPWSRGGYVYSEVSDHTSTLKFIEKRFNVTFDTISPWRRAVTSDLTHGFDFEHPDYSWPDLPGTEGDWNKTADQCEHLPPPVVPVEQHLPKQEEGVRKSRSLPYYLEATFDIDASTKQINMTIINDGMTGAAFQLYDNLIPDMKPRKYAAAENSVLLDDSLLLNSEGLYSFSLHGPNGFARHFSGNGLSDSAHQFNLLRTTTGVAITSNTMMTDLTLTDNAYNQTYADFGNYDYYAIDLTESGRWYDLTLGSKTDPGFKRRFMGRIENGEDSTSDPAMAVPQFQEDEDSHPENPEYLRDQPGWWENLDCQNERTSWKSICKDACVQASFTSASFAKYLMNDTLFLQ